MRYIPDEESGYAASIPFKNEGIADWENLSTSYVAKAIFSFYNPLAKANGNELEIIKINTDCYSRFAISNVYRWILNPQ